MNQPSGRNDIGSVLISWEALRILVPILLSIIAGVASAYAYLYDAKTRLENLEMENTRVVALLNAMTDTKVDQNESPNTNDELQCPRGMVMIGMEIHGVNAEQSIIRCFALPKL